MNISGKSLKEIRHKILRVFTQCPKTGKIPLRIVLEGLSLYNLGYSLEETPGLLKEQFGLEVKSQNLEDWVHSYSSLCRYSRLRPYALKLYLPREIIQTAHREHLQTRDFSVHRAKLALLLQEYEHGKFDNLREFLEAAQTECPNQFFQEGERSSKIQADFDLTSLPRSPQSYL